MAGATEIISLLMKHHTSAQDAIWPDQRYQVVGKVDRGNAVFVEGNIAKVSYVANVVSWMTVVFLESG